MRTSITLGSILIATTLSSVAKAQNTTTVVVSNPSHFKVGNRLYEGNLGGLRDYVDSLKRKDPDLYKSLDGKLSELESRRNTGLGIVIGGNVLGLGIVLAPLFISSSSDEPGSTSMVPLVVGLTISSASTLIGFSITPGRSDLLRFANTHNEQNESSPIEFHMGFAPTPGGGRGYLSATF